MSIKSTINVNQTISDKLDIASAETGVSKNAIITLLLERVLQEKNKPIKTNCQISYQERDKLKRWKKFHICYREDLYEFCQDMRKFYKMSISAVVAYSVLKYLNLIVIKMKSVHNISNIDNYPFWGFVITRDLVDGATLFTLTWGIPRELDKIYFTT